MKYIAAALFFIIGIPLYIDANGCIDTIRPPVIILSEDNNRIELENKQESVSLDQIVIIHPQLDSILEKVTDGLEEGSNLCFYITLMKYEDRLYIEMFEDYTNNYLFEIKNRRNSSYPRLNRNIYGYVKYNNIDIYLLLYSGSHRPDEEILSNLMHKTKNQIAVFKKAKDFYFIQENPMWLYEYSDGNINLIKSLNDKGFFYNP